MVNRIVLLWNDYCPSVHFALLFYSLFLSSMMITFMIFLFFVSGVDPKSVLCAFFKQGQCTKGDKCKFSHDLSLERKCEKRSLYVDGRDDELEKGESNSISMRLHI